MRITDVVSLEVEDGIGFLIVNNPPVNALGQKVRQGLADGIAAAQADEAIRAVVIIAEGRTFPAGADITEFGKPPQPPALPDVCQIIEDCAKPVVAALHGTALGGGFEIALSSHYRIADKGAKIGLPEINLGLLPGASGTQRMPRITGAGPALDMMLSGKPVPVTRGRDMGVIDEIAEGDLRKAAKAYALKLLKMGWGRRPTSERREGFKDMGAYNNLIVERRAELQKKAKGQLAPFKILDCVALAADPSVPFAEAMKAERAAFMECLASDQSKGMIHAFFAERQTAKIPEAKAATPRDLNKLAVIGGGTMGAGIAVAVLDAGMPVVMIERDAESLERGRANVEKVYARNVAKGRMSEAQKDAVMARWTGSVDYGVLADVDLVIEAVFEEMEVKKAVFAQLDAAMRQGAILATNTSYLNIDELAATISRPEDVIGLHFFSPANIMKLLEIVVPAKVTADVVVTAFDLAKRLGKVPVRAGVCDGFIGNRILATYRRAADYMMEDGASPYQIDAAIRDFGYPMGPYQVSDLAGGDIGWATRKRKAATRPAEERYVQIADRICENGWFGQKTGRGYYRYDGRVSVEDPEVLEIIEAERKRAGITPRDFTDDEIVERYFAAMINEGCNVLDEGIALRPLDIDVTLLYGYAFPRWRGGPMKYADMVGLDVILKRIEGYAAEDAHFWQPSPLLQRLVAEGRTFDDLNKGN
ncbi:MAG: enoyl-CoA hydratase/isomerase family protein [Rhodobacteraceae bacterium]|nr:enoyl-CoA hydratase/isomerase family protein [Paracoccaceae bacterium]